VSEAYLINFTSIEDFVPDALQTSSSYSIPNCMTKGLQIKLKEANHSLTLKPTKNNLSIQNTAVKNCDESNIHYCKQIRKEKDKQQELTLCPSLELKRLEKKLSIFRNDVGGATAVGSLVRILSSSF
jgi:hypothetical protein